MISKQYQGIVDAAESAGEVLKKYFGKKLEMVKEKLMPSDLQTTADLEAEKTILKVLNQHYPKYSIISEEVGEIKKDSDYSFVIDPLDGTNNFVLGIANFTSVIALVKGDKVIFSVVHSPMTAETFYAETGQGAYLNGHKIYVNNVSDFTKATIAHHVDYSANLFQKTILRKALTDKGIKRLLSYWSPAFELCLLAAGRIEGVIREKGVIHDFLAGKMIAMEAGAKVTGLDGTAEKDVKSDAFILSNATSIHQDLIEVMEEHLKN